jgi:hypothetical protein
VTGSIEKPQTLDIPVTITSTGSRTIAIREKRLNSREQEVAIAVLHRRKYKEWYPPAMWIDWMELEHTPTGENPHSKAPELFTKKITDTPEQAHAAQIIERFAARAFRHSKPDAAFLEKLTQVFVQRRAEGDSFDAALKESLSIVLAAPGFLYLSEPSSPGKPRAITDAELATRLSYFLWSAPPDAALRDAALSGTLHAPGVLAQHVDRMIASSRSQEFVTGFTHQWLGLDRLDFFRFNAQLFPEFDDSMKIAARNEVFATFAHLLQAPQHATRPSASPRTGASS